MSKKWKKIKQTKWPELGQKKRDPSKWACNNPECIRKLGYRSTEKIKFRGQKKCVKCGKQRL